MFAVHTCNSIFKHMPHYDQFDKTTTFLLTDIQITHKWHGYIEHRCCINCTNFGSSKQFFLELFGDTAVPPFTVCPHVPGPEPFPQIVNFTYHRAKVCPHLPWNFPFPKKPGKWGHYCSWDPNAFTFHGSGVYLRVIVVHPIKKC